MTNISLCKQDPIYFAERAIRIRPIDQHPSRYDTFDAKDGILCIQEMISLNTCQRQSLEAMSYKNENVLRFHSRPRSGRTTTACIFSLWQALNNNDSHTIIVSNEPWSTTSMLGNMCITLADSNSWPVVTKQKIKSSGELLYGAFKFGGTSTIRILKPDEFASTKIPCSSIILDVQSPTQDEQDHVDVITSIRATLIDAGGYFNTIL